MIAGVDTLRRNSAPPCWLRSVANPRSFFFFALYFVVLICFLYNCSVFIYSTVAGRKCEMNLIVIVIVRLTAGHLSISSSMLFDFGWNVWYGNSLALSLRRNHSVDSGPEGWVATRPCRWIRCSWWQSSLVPHVQCMQVCHPVGKWSQLAAELCSVQPVSVAKYQHSLTFTLAFSGMKCNRPLPLKQTSEEAILASRVVQTRLFEPEGYSHPPHASCSSWQLQHGCSDRLQQGWELEIKVLFVSEKQLLCSCLVADVEEEVFAAFKAFLFGCAREDVCRDMAKCSETKIVFCI